MLQLVQKLNQAGLLRNMQAASMRQQPASNSYMRHCLFSSRVFVQGLPAAWDENEISTRFSLAGPLSNVHLVRNAAGQKTGKVVIDYSEETGAEEAIQRFNNQPVDGQICQVNHYFDKK